MPLTDAELAAAEARLTQELRDLDLPTEGITDERVRIQALRAVAEEAPAQLSDDELRLVLREHEDGLKRLEKAGVDWQFRHKFEEEQAPTIVAVLEELDRRGARFPTANEPPAPGKPRRAWALARIGELGAFAWGGDTLRPRAVREWLAEQSAQALRTAGDDRPPISAVTKECARWSWSKSQVGEIFNLAFPPTPADRARSRFEHGLITRVASRRASLRIDGRDQAAKALAATAKQFIDLWLQDESDEEADELRRYAADRLS